MLERRGNEMVIDMIYRNESKPQKRPHVACTMMRFCSGADISPRLFIIYVIADK
jgi:hypothetical protein